MLSNFYWVIEKEIAGMGLPTGSRAYLYLEDADNAAGEELLREIQELHDNGVGALVSLTEVPIAHDRLEEADIRCIHLPVPDMTAPTPSQIDEFIAFAKEMIDDERPLVLHCLGGSGRTGTMIACYLVTKGRSADDAIDEVRRYRPSAIETHWQEDAVHQFAETFSKT
ncbi:MAG: dual specificity protein phosphatase family protein [Candidatus Hinthialibacter antarcticus]|nr:dual specificity protein phosphatase family protein [Candidatus Hinthialibacter antarcticus]